MARFGIRRSEDLTRPARAGVIGVHFDPDAFGRFSEGIARFLGTGRFLAGQTVIVVIWITLNVFAVSLRWDKYPFILLNLAFSTQAAYAAPLILLAQNRQDERDRAQAERDRDLNARTQAEAEFLARELAAVRLNLSDVATVEELQEAVHTLLDAFTRLEERMEARLGARDEAVPDEAVPDEAVPDVRDRRDVPEVREVRGPSEPEVRS